MFEDFGVHVANILKDMEEERSKLHHPFVGSEHLILSLFKNDKDFCDVMKSYDINYNSFKKELIRIVGTPKKNVDFNLYTPLLKRIINDAHIKAKEEKTEVSTMHLLISMLEEGEGVGLRILTSLKVDLDELYDEINPEIKESNVKISFGKNLNKTASFEEKTIGRDKEINYLIETLLRKKKNNPLLVGSAGVGKTAIVEELARKIVLKEVPDELKNKQIISLEMSSLVAGTKYRGEFEEKLAKIINEIEENNNIILFIDEMHTIVNAGGAEGAIGASDALKPYLARNTIKVIGATTTDEYDKYIAKDKALARRFENIEVLEPNLLETEEILMKVKGEYEKHHFVKVSKSDVQKIIKYSNEYIFSKKNPDKSLDFLDSVCVRAKVNNINNAKISKYIDKLNKIKVKKEDVVSKNDFKKATLYHEEEIKIEEKIKNYKLKNYIKITDKDILGVLEDKSNVPLLSSKEQIINALKTSLNSNVIGQEKAINNIIKCFEYKYQNINNLVSLLIYGDVGVGKSKVLNLIEHTTKFSNVIKIDGSEYTHESSIYKLTGLLSNYNDNYLFNSLKHNPYSLILIENYDKCALNIKLLFKQIFEKEYILDYKNDKISFKNCMILATITKTNDVKVGFDSSVDSNFVENYSEFSAYVKFDNITEEDLKQYIKLNNINMELKTYNYKKYGFKNIRESINKISL